MPSVRHHGKSGFFPFRTSMAPFVVGDLTKYPKAMSVQTAMDIFWKTKYIHFLVQTDAGAVEGDVGPVQRILSDGSTTPILDEQDYVIAHYGLYWQGSFLAPGVAALDVQIFFGSSFTRGGASANPQVSHADSIKGDPAALVYPVLCVSFQYDGTGGSGYSMDAVSQTEDGAASGVDEDRTSAVGQLPGLEELLFRGDLASATVPPEELIISTGVAQVGADQYWSYGGRYSTDDGSLLTPF